MSVPGPDTSPVYFKVIESYCPAVTVRDEENRAATFFATFHGHHTGEGGPVPPTNREMRSHYVFVMFMNGDDRVEKVYKTWNAAWAMKQLGWA